MVRLLSGIRLRYVIVPVFALCVQLWLLSILFKANPATHPAKEIVAVNENCNFEDSKRNQLQRIRLDSGTDVTRIQTEVHGRNIREHQVMNNTKPPRTRTDTHIENYTSKEKAVQHLRPAAMSTRKPFSIDPDTRKTTTVRNRLEKRIRKDITAKDIIIPEPNGNVKHRHGRSMKSTKDEDSIQVGIAKQDDTPKQDNISKQRGLPKQDGILNQDGVSKQDGVPNQDEGPKLNDILKRGFVPLEGGKHNQDKFPGNVTSLPLDDITVCHNILAPGSKPVETHNWYKIADREIYAFSAYYEERESANRPLIRVLAIGLQLQFSNIGALHCALIFKGLSHPVSVQATYEYIYPSNLWPDEYTAHWILCPVPRELVQQRDEPVSVSVLPSACEPLPHFLLPVHVRQPRTRRKKIALCLPALYGGQDWAKTAEWIILHKLLGYSTVFFYIKSFSMMTNKVLRLYSHGYDPDIKVKAMPWTLPKLKQFYLGQHASINDCLYRAGLDHDYVTISDKDELLIPMKYPTILDCLNKFETNNTAAYMFQHIMFNLGKTEPLKPSEIKNITGIDIHKHKINIADLQLTSLTQKWHMKEPYPAETVRSKTIYNSNRTISADIHTPRHLVSGFTELMVAPSDGAVYHYRDKPPDSWLYDVPYEHGTQVERYRVRLLTGMVHLLGKLNPK